MVERISKENAQKRWDQDLHVLAAAKYDGEEGIMELFDLWRGGKKSNDMMTFLMTEMILPGNVEFYVRNEWIVEESRRKKNASVARLRS